MEETISLKDLIKTIRKRLGLITFLIILTITIVGVLSFQVLKPVYQSSTEILVNQSPTEGSQLTDQNIETDLQLINTYSAIIKSPVILDQVVEEMNLDMSTDQLTEAITVSNLELSQIVTISVQDKDPEMAVEIANTTASIFEADIQELMNINNVKILSPAVMKENPVPVSPNGILNMTIAAVFGLMAGVGIAFLLEYLDTTVKNPQDVEDVLGLPLLGIVSIIVEKAEFEVAKEAKSKKGWEKEWLKRKRLTSRQPES